jgi:transglycosylase-like protein with SLT domain
MLTPRPRGTRRSFVLFSLSIAGSVLCSTLLPSAERIALAKDGYALGDTLILAGPGGQYGILSVAPSGSVLSVDGDPVDGYYPVTFQGVSGWTATGLVQVANDGGGDGGNGGGGGGGKGGNGNGDGGNRGTHHENGNGGTETVSADPIYSDGSAPVEAAPSSSSDTPVSGGTYGPGGGGYSEDQIVGIIHEAAGNYGQSPDDMLRVARCESGLNPSAVGGGGSYYGLYQFVPSTFAGTPYGSYDIFDPWANANAAAWMWSEGHKGDWVCQ